MLPERRLCYDESNKGSPGMIKMNKKRLIISSVIILVVVGGGIAAFVWWVQFNSGASLTTSGSSKKVTQYAPNDQKLVDDLNQKYGMGDYQGAIKLLEGQQSIQDTNTQLLLAGAYANAGDYKKALQIYQTLDKAGKLPQESLGNMGDMAEKAGDTAAAIAAYKRAKSFAASSNEVDDQGAVYDYKIAQLEKKQ